MEQVNIAGNQIFSIMIVIGYWIILISGIGQILSAVAKRDVQGALKQALSHGTAFASVYLLKWMLDTVKGIFG